MLREGEEAALARVGSRRTLLLGGLQLAALGLLAERLFRLQVVESSRYRPLAEDNRIRTELLAPERGRILDRLGEVLADNEPRRQVVLLGGHGGDIEAILDRLEAALGRPLRDRAALAERGRGLAAGTSLVLAEGLSFEETSRLAVVAARLDAVDIRQGLERRYPIGPPLSHVLGHLGAIERRGVDDEPVRRVHGVRVGKAGVELAMEPVLAGQPGRARVEVDARGRLVRRLTRSEPVAGRDVALTIDAGLQRAVHARVEREQPAALVVLDALGGNVLALASAPAFEPVAARSGAGDGWWQRQRRGGAKPFLNRVVAGQYPPGSTFKMVTALAALEAGVVTAEERIHCPGHFSLGENSYRCWHRSGHGALSLVPALARSCDVYFYEIARRTGIDRIATMARRLGLGQTYDCGLPFQRRGLVPDQAWKRLRLGHGWASGDTVIAGIGQGFVLATPLQLAVMTARLATGRAVLPRLILSGGHEAAEQPAPGLQIAPALLDLVRAGMIEAVNGPGATGTRARLDGVPEQVAGKTGTSQVTARSGRDESYQGRGSSEDHALFVAYYPAGSPRYAVAAVVEHGGSGGARAAPLVRDVLAMLAADDPFGRRSEPAGPTRLREGHVRGGRDRA